MQYTNKGAIMSSCRKYRYVLWREWDKHALLKVGPWRTARPLVFAMLNPSTADSDTDDNTVRKCVLFAKHLGYARNCLGRTKAGAPRHPLYVALNTPLEPFP